MPVAGCAAPAGAERGLARVCGRMGMSHFANFTEFARHEFYHRDFTTVHFSLLELRGALLHTGVHGHTGKRAQGDKTQELSAPFCF